jgi:hypothetical protein
VAGCLGASGRPIIGVRVSEGSDRFLEGAADVGTEKLVGPWAKERPELGPELRLWKLWNTRRQEETVRPVRTN